MNRQIVIFLFSLVFALPALTSHADEVLLIQTEASAASIKDVYPESKGTEDIQLSWIVTGASYGLRYNNHYFELHLLSSEFGGMGRVDPFFIRGESPENGNERIKEISEDIKVRVLGVYYTPFFGPGVLLGLGVDQWTFSFNSLTRSGEKERDDSDNEFLTKITTYSPIFDVGYQFGDESLVLVLKARVGIPKKPIINICLGYLF